MSQETQKIDVILTRIISPTEFWITIPTDGNRNELCPYNNADFNKQKTYREYLQWIKGRDERKCHLAFVIPIDSICWTLTAIDKFKVYAKQFERYAVSIPHTANAPAQSTPVILWGLMRVESETSETETDDEQPIYAWRNINLQMVFQGVARSIVHIKHLSSGSAMPWQGSQGKLALNHVGEHQHEGANGKIGHKKVDQWLPAEQCRLKEFTGTPVFIDDQLTIYVQQWENQECIKLMSEVSSKRHQNHALHGSRKCWKKGDICVAPRNSDGMYYRAEIQQVYAKQQTCLVNWVDFGCTDLLQFEKLSTLIDFGDVPIQVMQCHLSNVIPISDDHTKKAKKLCRRLICNQLCVIYVHDNPNVGQSESIACNIQSSNVSLDLSSLLISRGLVQHKTHSYHKFDQVTESQVDFKRIRTESDAPIIKNSSDLHTYKDFKEFFRSHRAINPMDEANKSHANDDDDDESRIFEIFEPPSKSCRWDEIRYKRRTIHSEIAPHLAVDRISEHFELMTINQPTFKCRCMYIMDPVTLLIQLPDVKSPNIARIDEHPGQFPEEYAPVIAYSDYAWRRGILWERVSTSKHAVLFVDTLQIVDIPRNCIQKCPAEYLETLVPYAKVHLYKIKPNERVRASDICSMLEALLINKDLFAKVIARHSNGIPEIKLYESEEAKRTIYHSLTKQKFFQRI